MNTNETKKDLKPRQGLTIDKLPSYARCDCCGRHISELKLFGKEGDPLVGNFEGAILVKTYRPDALYDEESVLALEAAEKFYEQDGEISAQDWLINKYGEKRGIEIFIYAQICCSVSRSCECRDCVVSNEYEYFERLVRRKTHHCD